MHLYKRTVGGGFLTLPPHATTRNARDDDCRWIGSNTDIANDTARMQKTLRTVRTKYVVLSLDAIGHDHWRHIVCSSA